MEHPPKRILIVDDEPLILEVLDIHLSGMGLVCRTAGSAEIALDIVTDFQPDLILSDFRMPKVDGVELLSRVRGRGIAAPFFIMSGYSDERPAFAAKTLQLTGIIEKPFQMTDLKKMIAPFL